MKSSCLPRRVLLWVALLWGAAAAAQPAEPVYSEVRLRPTRETALFGLASRGVALDHVRRGEDAAGPYVDATLSDVELAEVRAAGVAYEVLVPDVVSAFEARPRLTPEEQRAVEQADPLQGFEFGTMAGFYRLNEMVTELDSMRLLYPHLVTEKVSLGLSHEGREVWMVKISDNPEVDELEPEVLYTAIHHAREPQSLMTVMYFMYYLLENYGTDSLATAIVNERELYFIPMLNPDGYARNEATNPSGGGMWRKNRRNNGGGSFGVDPNRNYGYNWGYDNNGSSPNPSSETYRGPSAFSEPENQAIRDFAEDREIVAALHYHSYGDMYIFPWGYATQYTPDDALFRSFSADMSAHNGYDYGIAIEVNYYTNGSAYDWMYGEQTTKPKALAWTVEVGGSSDGFWPPMSRIFPLAQENLMPNLVLAQRAGELGVPTGTSGPPETAGDFALSAAYPNPFNPNTALTLRLARAQHVVVEALDGLGRRVALLHEGALAAGTHRLALDASGLPSGLYLVRAIGEAGSVHRPVTLLK